jgi:hypothetical protein
MTSFSILDFFSHGIYATPAKDGIISTKGKRFCQWYFHTNVEYMGIVQRPVYILQRNVWR